VTRILRDRCVACHREGEIAPFSLATYRQAAGWASMIDEVVQGGRMPPWFALGEPEARRRDDGRYDVTSRSLPPAGTASVYLAGTFNDWKPMALKMSGPDPSGRFETKLTLAAGTHE
jgi:hypothetical protein